ncbi:MAG: hypothetical protein PHT81_00915 [Endomicrobiaceae bacterium]|nr:hypothetical protein [Endomicrobiaceae bacterium]
MKFNRGSEWRKWDLHIHTPKSIVNNYGEDTDIIWEKFIKDLEDETLYPDGSVIGISDYYFLDGYDKVCDFKNKGRLKNIHLIIPIIELRLNNFSGCDDSLSRVNYHIAFDPSLTSEVINIQFIHAITSKYSLTPRYLDLQLSWNSCITKESLKSLGKSIKQTVPADKLKDYGSDFIEGFNNLNLNLKDLKEVLSRPDFISKTISFVGKCEWANIPWNNNTIADKKHIINSADFVFNAYENIEQSQKDYEILSESNLNNRVLDCSDAHDFSAKKDTKDRLGNCNTWIKGDPCFETLRQALFSYDTRVNISQKSPLGPLDTISYLTLDFPKEAKIENTPLCFAGKKNEIYFNNYLNCIIGGRGVGKSLLLQFICKDNPDKIDESNNILNKIENYKSFINIGNTNYEYYGQGAIEKYYKDENAFRKAINSRLVNFWKTYKYKKTDGMEETIDSCVAKDKKDLESHLETIDKQIENTKKFIQNDIELKKIYIEISKREKILSVIQDSDYKKIQEKTSNLNTRLLFIQQSRIKFQSLIDQINKIILSPIIQIPDIHKDIAFYAEEYNKLLKELKKLKESITIKEMNSETAITTELKETELGLKSYLEKRGVSLENINNSLLAEKELLTYKSRETELKKEQELFKYIDITNISQVIQKIAENYEKDIEQILQITENSIKYTNKSKEVSWLTFKTAILTKNRLYDFFNDFIKQHTGIIRQSDYEALLNRRKTDEDNKSANSLLAFCKTIDLEVANKLKIFLEHSDAHKHLYDLYYLKHKYNLIKYLGIDTLYKNKNLENLSFGQRATAVILMFLIFGTSPIIIDEPEIHLDQKMISEDLVEIIKKVKNNRQIIFATHNANIVINADADLIIALEQDEQSGMTSIKTMTIENLENRKQLLTLEGSKEAFLLREHKYNIITSQVSR